MHRGDREFKVTVFFTDGTMEELIYNLASFDQAAFHAGAVIGLRGDYDRVVTAEVQEIITDTTKY